MRPIEDPWTTRYQSSNPNSTIAGNGVQRPNLVSGVSLGTKGSLYQRLNGYINPAAFTQSPAYTFGNAPRTLSLRGPGYENWDISLFKNVVVRDRVNVQFRAQTFNTFNTPLFAGPNTAFGSANFGAITPGFPLDTRWRRVLLQMRCTSRDLVTLNHWGGSILRLLQRLLLTRLMCARHVLLRRQNARNGLPFLKSSSLRTRIRIRTSSSLMQAVRRQK